MFRLIILLASLLLPALLPAQDSVRTNVLPKKNTQHIQVLVRQGNSFVIERYNTLKSTYHFMRSDTVVLSSGFWKTKFDSIPDSRFAYTVSACDTSLNIIRNQALRYDELKYLIDYSAEVLGPLASYTSYLRSHHFDLISIPFKICTTDFTKQLSERSAFAISQIDSVKNDAILFDLRVRNGDVTAGESVKNIAAKKDNCLYHQGALAYLIISQTDEFITACNLLPEKDFEHILSLIRWMDASIAFVDAEKIILNSKVKTKRRDDLLRAIKKNAKNR